MISKRVYKKDENGNYYLHTNKWNLNPMIEETGKPINKFVKDKIKANNRQWFLIFCLF